MKPKNKIDIREFIDAGYLQEVNRQFLHPLGLALEVQIDDKGNYFLSGIQDYRDDPDGMIFFPHKDLYEKANAIKTIYAKRKITRKNSLGYIVQPARFMRRKCSIKK